MRRSVLVLSLLAGGAGGALPARAEVVNTAREGMWVAYGGVANDGKRVCGIGETGTDGRTFQIKYFENAQSFEIVIGKPGWAIPPGTQAEIAITFDRSSPWRGMAKGNGLLLFLSLPMTRLVAFEAEFKAAYSMIVSFPGGTEAPWRGDLTGSTAIAGHMARCIRTLLGTAAPGNDQPFGAGGGTTQPFGTTAAPPQPFGQPPATYDAPSPAAPEESFPSVKIVPGGSGSPSPDGGRMKN